MIPRAALLVAALLGFGAPAFAAPAPGNSDQPTPVMVVLDASGSMNQADAPGPRIAAAKRAVRDMVAELPADARVGLMAYGSRTGSRDEDKAASCKDILTLQPVGQLNKAAITGAAEELKASGYTPIGAALQAAQAELPTSGPRAIVLVSDGEDTCAPPQPCAVAKSLKEAGIDLVVHTVGFKVDENARRQLACIAAATGGTYREAGSGAALGVELRRGVERAIKPYTAVGAPVRGAAAQAGAPALRPGQYLDTYAAGGRTASTEGTVKFYALTLKPGDSPHVSATIAPPPQRAGVTGVMAVSAQLVAADGQGCGLSSRDSADVAVFGKLAPQTSTIDGPPVGGPPWATACSSGTAPVFLRVARIGDAYRSDQLPVEITVRVEPPVVETGPAAIPATEAELPAPAAGSATPVEAGRSFNDAPELTAGTYSGSITTGETRYVRVPVGWGQRLAYRVTFPPVPGVVAQSASLSVSMASPLRSRAATASGQATSPFLGGPQPVEVTGSTAAPVRYLNRESAAQAVQGYSVDGGYYLILDLSYRLGGGGSIDFPYVLTIATSGSGAGPVYETDPGTETSAAPPAAAAPVAPADSGPPGWLLGVIAAAGIALAAALLVWWRRSATRPETGIHRR